MAAVTGQRVVGADGPVKEIGVAHFALLLIVAALTTELSDAGAYVEPAVVQGIGDSALGPAYGLIVQGGV